MGSGGEGALWPGLFARGIAAYLLNKANEQNPRCPICQSPADRGHNLCLHCGVGLAG